MNRRSSVLLMCFASLFLVNLNLSPVSAQLGGGTGGGTGGTGGLEGEIIDAVNAGGGVGGGGVGGTGTNSGTGGDTAGDTAAGPNLEDLANILDSQSVEIVTPANDRDQPFVGVSAAGSMADSINEFRHVGPLNEFIVGSGGTGTTGGNQGGFSAAGVGGGLGGGLGGSTSGFTVPRTQAVVRSRIVPGFQLTPMPSNVVASRFNRRVAALPATRQMAGQVNVTMQGRTAVITGVANAQQVDRIRRQLRLEPGVTRIVNQARAGQ